MKLSEEQIDKLLSDVGVFKTLLRMWLEQWDIIEEYAQNDVFSHERIEKLADLTKRELENKGIGPAK